MKKTKFVSITILSAILLLCFMDFTVAAPPSYVGIRNGETYTWKADIAADNINTTAETLLGDNWTILYPYLAELWQNTTHCPFNFLLGAGLRVTLTNVSDEILNLSPYIPSATGVKFDEYVSMCNNNYTLAFNSSGYSLYMMYISDPSYLNQTNWMYYLGSGTPLFMPIGINWALLATYWNAQLLTSPYTSGNVTITALSNGLQVDLNDKYLEWVFTMMIGEANITFGTLSDTKFTLTWNSKGVFSKGEVEYGGLLLATGYLEEGGLPGIPGYELYLFMGITMGSTLGLIYGVMRKKKKDVNT